MSRSSNTDALRALSRSKNAAGPRRAPSGRRVDSTLITSIPARASSCPHNGPAHSEERSTTRTPRSDAVGGAGADGVAITALRSSLRSPSAATARPSSAAESTSCAAGRCATAAARSDHGSPSPRRQPTRATVRGRRRRGSATASQLSAVGSRRVEPPQLTSPRTPEAGERRTLTEQGWTVDGDCIPRGRRRRAQLLRRCLEHPDDSRGRAERRRRRRRPVSHIPPLLAHRCADPAGSTIADQPWREVHGVRG